MWLVIHVLVRRKPASEERSEGELAKGFATALGPSFARGQRPIHDVCWSGAVLGLRVRESWEHIQKSKAAHHSNRLALV